MHQTPHQPVLPEQVVALLDPQPGMSYFDGTAGYGGHAQLILDRLGPTSTMVLADRDEEAVQYLRERFGSRAEVRHLTFQEAAKQLLTSGRRFDAILLDLGVSSAQLDEARRGFSFRLNGPLDMRMDQSQDLIAADVANTYSEDQLVRILSEYGQEHRSRTVARAIVVHRPFTTTEQLAEVVRRVVPRTARIDSATRTFQALRIEVNDELTGLRQGLPLLLELLQPGGRLAVISFHSLEDRLVKRFFEAEAKDCICPPRQPICTCDHRAIVKLLTRGAVKGETEDSTNPRARSAKLRAIEKLIPTQKEGK